MSLIAKHPRRGGQIRGTTRLRRMSSRRVTSNFRIRLIRAIRGQEFPKNFAFQFP